ncbi:MAG: hypothetical protein WBQ29_14860, partial [Isosphaeraceae bacterium]
MSSSSPASFARLPGVLHGQVGGEADNVIEDIARQELGVLQDDADLAADLAEVQGRQLATIVGDRAGIRGFESEQEPHDCGLPRAGGTDDGDELAGADLQAHVAEHLGPFVLAGIAERDRAKGQGSAQAHRLEHGGGELGLRLQDRLDPVVERRQIEQVKQGVAHGKNRGDHVGECDGQGK